MEFRVLLNRFLAVFANKEFGFSGWNDEISVMHPSFFPKVGGKSELEIILCNEEKCGIILYAPKIQTNTIKERAPKAIVFNMPDDTVKLINFCQKTLKLKKK